MALGAVLVLRLLRRHHHDAGRQVGDAHGRIGRVDVLAAGAGGAHRVDADVLGRISMSTSSASGSTATVAAEVWMRPLRLGLRHALHPVHAGFELQLRRTRLPGDRGDDFLVAADLAFAGREHLDLPAGRRHSARTCGTGRRQTVPPRRRRCRRGFRGSRSSRRPRPAAAAAIWISCSQRLDPFVAPRAVPPRRARACRGRCRVGQHRLEVGAVPASALRSAADLRRPFPAARNIPRPA